MTVELYYFDGCPSYEQAHANIKKALQAEGLPDDVVLVRVTSASDAQVKRLIGSPTIRIDGVDLEGPTAEARGYGLGCRVYLEDGKMVGWPSSEQIRHVVRGVSASDRPAAEPATSTPSDCCGGQESH